MSQWEPIEEREKFEILSAVFLTVYALRAMCVFCCAEFIRLMRKTKWLRSPRFQSCMALRML